MSLAQRIARASAPVDAPQRPLVPCDLLREVLVDNELLVHTGCPVSEVHAALLALHRRKTEAEANRPASPPRAAAPRCPHCHVGREVLDAREGHRVCDSCGAVLTLRAINVEPEFVKPAEEPNRPGDKIQGVSKWLVQELAAPERPRHSSYWEDLEHWNQFVHAGEEGLRDMDRTLREWTDGGHTRMARMVATMLYPLMRHRFPDAALIRERLRRGEALPAIEHLEPARTFACPTCGDMRHTAKDARFHCRHGFGKRKRY